MRRAPGAAAGKVGRFIGLPFGHIEGIRHDARARLEIENLGRSFKLILESRNIVMTWACEKSLSKRSAS